MNNTTCELRNKAAKIIEEKGLAFGILQNDKGECCILGSLLIAKGIKINYREKGTDWHYKHFITNEDLKTAIKEMDFENVEQAYDFNDSFQYESLNPKQEVINRLRMNCNNEGK